MKQRLVAVAVSLVAAVSLAGCGSSSGSGDSSAGGGSSAAGSKDGGGGAAAASGKVVNVCSVVSAAAAAQLAGQPYTQAVSQTGDWTAQCAYNNDDATAEGVNLTYWDHNAANTWKLVRSSNGTEVSGLGDKAFWDNDNTLYVLSGSDLIQVNGLSSQDKSEALAKPLLDALK